jgi:hypothetical protein
VQRYEQLRDQALNQLSCGCAMALFIHQGMAAWMKAWISYVPEGQRPPREDKLVQKNSSKKIQADIVMILVGMALSCTKGGKDDN